MQAVGIPVGSGFIQISNGLTLGYPAGLYVTIYSKVDESGKAEQWLSYEFGKTPSFLNYNHENGDIDKETADIEFDLFLLYLEEGVKASTRAIAHSVRDSYKYIDDARRNNLQSIMEKWELKLAVTAKETTAEAVNKAASSVMAEVTMEAETRTIKSLLTKALV